MRDVQSDHDAVRGGRAGLRVAIGRQQLAGHAIEFHRRLLRRHVASAGAGQRNGGVGVARVIHGDAFDLAAPVLFRLAHERRDRRQRRGHAGRLAVARAAGKRLGEEGILIALVGGRGAGRHVQEHQGDQARVGDHDVVGQGQHGRHVVRVEPRALALFRPEGKQVLEDALVRDDAADDGNEHEHGAETHDPAAPDGRHVVQVEMQAVEEFAAARLARLGQHLARGRVGFFAMKIATPSAFLFAGPRRFAPAQLRGGIALAGQADEPARGARGALVHRLLRDLGRFLGADLAGGGAVQFGLHPQGDFIAVVAGRAGAKHQQQNPADEQAGPGVQPCHRLAETFFHARLQDRASIHCRMAAMTAAGINRPSQARRALRVAKTHITAQV